MVLKRRGGSKNPWRYLMIIGHDDISANFRYSFNKLMMLLFALLVDVPPAPQGDNPQK